MSSRCARTPGSRPICTKATALVERDGPGIVFRHVQAHGRAVVILIKPERIAQQLDGPAAAAVFRQHVQQADPAAAGLLVAPGVELDEADHAVPAQDAHDGAGMLLRVPGGAAGIELGHETLVRLVHVAPGVPVALEVKRLVAREAQRLIAQILHAAAAAAPPGLAAECAQCGRKVAVVVIILHGRALAVDEQQAHGRVVAVGQGGHLAVRDAQHRAQIGADGHAVAHEDDRLPVVPRGEILYGALHALLHVADRLAAGHGPAVGVGVEIAHLLRKIVLDIAPGAALPHAHADLRQARRDHGRNVMIARDRLGRCACA